MLAITRELQHQFLERDDQIEAIIYALLARQNVVAFGEPGTGKSDLLHTLAGRIIDSTYYRVLMDRQMDKAELLGGLHLPHYRDTGEYKRNTRNTLLEAHIALIDELDKSGPGTTTPLLTAINEHIGDDGTGWRDLDLIIAMGAANQEFDSGQEAFRDRFLVGTVFERLRQPDNVRALIKSQFVPRVFPTPTTVTLEAVRHVIDVEVPAVEVPDSVIDALVAIREELAEESIFPSDRRLKQSGALIQSKTWLEGRQVATEDDLVAVRHSLWDRQEQRQKVASIVLSHTGPVTRMALTLMQALAEIDSDLQKLDGESRDDRANAGGGFQYSLGEMRKQLTRAREAAETSGHDTARLDEVEEAIQETHVRVLVDVLNTPEESARRAVSAMAS